ncbi:hypothetical protein GCWU000324_02959 [Kingella oralis ATCC 51147]|uniref:Uncharacterized protein n=1 Tax=Kingella oralis ATCC 51147 TaxID=629741 RepID=C4GMM4_9NEIS|nr:hypothetical protein GCWU000324_02959 [Kingella oralis ATCC 51147]
MAFSLPAASGSLKIICLIFLSKTAIIARFNFHGMAQPRCFIFV